MSSKHGLGVPLAAVSLFALAAVFSVGACKAPQHRLHYDDEPPPPKEPPGEAGERVRTRASFDLACPESEIQVAELDHGPAQNYTAEGCGKRTAYAVICPIGFLGECDIRLDSPILQNEPAAEGDGAKEPEREPPDGLAGMAFGMSAEQARAACEDAGHTFHKSANGPTCSATPEPVGFDSSVKLKLCSGKVCMVRVRDTRSDGGSRGILKRLVDLKTSLDERYGAPTTVDAGVPEECMESEELGCILEGRVKADYRWQFSPGHRIRLRLRVFDDKPALELRYEAPKAATGNRAL